MACAKQQLAIVWGPPGTGKTDTLVAFLHAVVREGKPRKILIAAPNYRTAEMDAPFTPLTVKQKFTIARKDTFDWPSYILAGAFAGVSQVNNSNPSFGQGRCSQHFPPKQCVGQHPKDRRKRDLRLKVLVATDEGN